MEFNLAEKLAIVKMVDALIYADDVVHQGEVNAMGKLMPLLDFDSNFILQARNISKSQALLVLNAMSEKKKRALVIILEKVAISDGFKHEKEMELLLKIFDFIGVNQPKK